jgi:hypothetical protein
MTRATLGTTHTLPNLALQRKVLDIGPPLQPSQQTRYDKHTLNLGIGTSLPVHMPPDLTSRTHRSNALGNRVSANGIGNAPARELKPWRSESSLNPKARTSIVSIISWRIPRILFFAIFGRGSEANSQRGRGAHQQHQ